MNRIIFNIAAKTDRAGRPSTPNQDNIWVCPDLTKFGTPTDKILGTDEDIELSEKGALLVVADGMGGMNAGEVASRLVIDGIKRKFSNIPDSILTDESEIQQFISNAIIESDESIKLYAKDHREAEGLGSTIVLLWVLNGKAYCGWCGDSRIYRYNPNNELVRLSHDHSYVQSLVDEGKITEDEAFDHPDGNIITKALGDNGSKADPELRTYDVYQRDVFILCSDGLCGLLTDAEIYDVIQATCTSSKDSLNALWNKGQETGWSDNASIDVLCIVDGGKPAKGRPDGYPIIAKKPVEKKAGSNKAQIVSGGENVYAKILKPPYLYILALVALCLLGLALYNVFGSNGDEGSTNHEYNIEVPASSDGNDTEVNTLTNGNHEGSTIGGRQGNSNANTGNSNPGRTNATPGRNTGNNGNSWNNNQNNNGHQNNNGNTGNNNAQHNGNNGGINQGVIDQLNQNGNNSNGHSIQQPAEQHPSADYMQFFNNVLNDYNKASRAWNQIKRQKYRTRQLENDIYDFMDHIDTNINSLVSDQANYKALKEKGKIQNFKALRDDIKRNFDHYGTTPPGRYYENDGRGNSCQNGSQSQQNDDMYNL